MQGVIAVEKPKIQSSALTEKTVPTHVKQDIDLYKKSPEFGDKIGTLTIPVLDMAAPIYHGTSEWILNRGVGHMVESAQPGQNKQIVLSAHRETLFRRLGEVKYQDDIIISNDAGDFLYRVKNVRIVDRDDRSALLPKGEKVLTVTTCYPFQYIGYAPKRYIVEAELISAKLRKGEEG
ncbi:class D sortase [Bacillaceae bacterium S4-13-58]